MLVAVDGAGAVTSIGGEDDITTIGYSYDLLGRMTSSSDSALVKTIDYTNDLRGLRTGLTLDGTTVAYGYDNAGRLETVQKTGETLAATYGYDTGGRRDSLLLPNGVSTSYDYDDNDRLKTLTTTGPGGTLASFTYTLDPTGNRDAITYADGSKSDYEYDGAYRLTKETRTETDGTTPAYEITYQYDNVGNRIRMTSSGHAKAYRADTASTGGTQVLFHLDEPEGATVVEDSSGLAQDGTVGSGVTLGVEGRIGTAAEFDGTSGAQISVPDDPALELPGDFTIEAWVCPASVTGIMNVVTKWAAPQDGKYTYRLFVSDGIPGVELSVQGLQVYSLSGTEAIPVDEWTHLAVVRKGDGADNVRLLVNEVEVATATVAGALYDGGAPMVVGASARLGEVYPFVGIIDEVRVSRVDRSTDGPGGTSTFGKAEVNYRYNARNQLTVEYAGPTLVAPALPADKSVKTYSYDKNGNATDIVETVGTVEISSEHMEYDELNRMTSHEGPNGTESFTYRGAEWHRFSQNGGADGEQFLYDGDNVLADIAGGVTDALYVTPFLDQNLSMTNAAGTYYYSQDGLGSVRTLTNAAGAVVNNYDYLPFGGTYSPTTTVSLPQRYTYTGREKNPASALMYYRYRQYDPRVGRFGARDRLEPNHLRTLYSYALSSPLNYYDPSGLVQVLTTATLPTLPPPGVLVTQAFHKQSVAQLVGKPCDSSYPCYYEWTFGRKDKWFKQFNVFTTLTVAQGEWGTDDLEEDDPDYGHEVPSNWQEDAKDRLPGWGQYIIESLEGWGHAMTTGAIIHIHMRAFLRTEWDRHEFYCGYTWPWSAYCVKEHVDKTEVVYYVFLETVDTGIVMMAQTGPGDKTGLANMMNAQDARRKQFEARVNAVIKPYE